MKTVYFFSREQCHTCHSMYPIWNEALAGVTSHTYEVIDCDDNFDFAKAHDVTTLPTFIVVDESGKELARRSGFVKGVTFNEWLRSV